MKHLREGSSVRQFGRPRPLKIRHRRRRRREEYSVNNALYQMQYHFSSPAIFNCIFCLTLSIPNPYEFMTLVAVLGLKGLRCSDPFVCYVSHFSQRGWINKKEISSLFKNTFYPCTVFRQPRPLPEGALSCR